MSIIFDDKYIDGNFIEDNILNNDIYNIIKLIKNCDYEKAMSIFKQKNISFKNIVSRSHKLKIEQLVSFINYVLLHK